MAGAAMIVIGHDVMEEEFWDLFENEHVTAFHGVGSTYDLVRKLDIFCEDYPDLRLMTQAGGKLDRELHQYFAQYANDCGKLFFVLYGQSEATAGVSYLPAQRSLDKLVSVGIPYPGGKIELVDAAGNQILEPHVPGELIYRGENAALGYAVCGEDLIPRRRLARRDSHRRYCRAGRGRIPVYYRTPQTFYQDVGPSGQPR